MNAGGPPSLRMTAYDLAEGATHAPDDGQRKSFLYVRKGQAVVGDDMASKDIKADDGCFVAGKLIVEAGSSAWLFTVTPCNEEAGLGEVVLSEPVSPGFSRPYLLRADRIESPAHAITPRHGHRGPGMRRLVDGRLSAAVGDRVERIEAGGAWFETGFDPVIGTNIGEVNTIFVRLMLLPAELEGGQSSFVPMNDGQAGRPRSVKNRLFQEIYLEARSATSAT